jgi:hypothetical protein
MPQLPTPFSRRIAQSLDAAEQATLYGRFDKTIVVSV